MGKEVRIWARAKEPEEGETRCDNYPALACDWEPATGHDLRGRQDSDGTEHRRRSSHRIVVSAGGDGGEGVTADSGEHNEPETRTRAELVTHCSDQHGARGCVADHVRRIDMKC